MIKLQETIDGFTILRLLEETNKAFFYICERDNINISSGTADLKKDNSKFIFKLYKCQKKCYTSLENKTPLNAVEVIKDGTFFDKETASTFQYEVMPYLDTEPLGPVPMNEKDAYEIIQKISECLHNFHQKGFIHRNVTPSNILIEKQKKEAILVSYRCLTEIDVIDDLDETLTKIFKPEDEVTGTPGYIAPETYTGVITPAVDYYSLGAVLFYLLTGKELFETNNEQPDKLQDNFQQIKKKVLSNRVVNLINNNALLSISQKKIICALMTLQHNKRWGYKEVSMFLKGENVPVYYDWNLEPFVFCHKRYINLKLLIDAFVKNQTQATKVIQKGRFTNYLYHLGLNEKAKELEQFLNNKNCNLPFEVSSEKIVPLTFLILNNLDYKLSKEKILRKKEDLENLTSKQLQKKVELLISEKDKIFILWLELNFEVDMSIFYSELEGENNWEKLVAINEKRIKEGLWTILISYLKEKKIVVETKALSRIFYFPVIQQLLKRHKPYYFSLVGSVLLLKTKTKILVYDLKNKKLISASFNCNNGKLHFYNTDEKTQNELISVVFEAVHVISNYKKNNNKKEKRILTYVNKDYIDSLSSLTQFFFFIHQYQNKDISLPCLIENMTKIRNRELQNTTDKNILLMLELGKLFYQLDRKEDAKICFKKGISIDKENERSSMTYINDLALAVCQFYEKQDKEAYGLFKYCKENRPELFDEHINELYKNCAKKLGLQA